MGFSWGILIHGIIATSRCSSGVQLPGSPQELQQHPREQGRNSSASMELLANNCYGRVFQYNEDQRVSLRGWLRASSAWKAFVRKLWSQKSHHSQSLSLTLSLFIPSGFVVSGAASHPYSIEGVELFANPKSIFPSENPFFCGRNLKFLSSSHGCVGQSIDGRSKAVQAGFWIKNFQH